jgi:hypothetical protein
MKIENIYTELLKIENALKDNHTAAAQDILATLRDALAVDICTEKAARNGNKKITAAALAILKASTKDCPALKKAYRCADGVTISDGYRAIIFNAESAPALPENERGAIYPNFEIVLKNAAGNTQPLTLPAAESLRAFIKIRKAEEAAKPKNKRAPAILYELENGQTVDADFLLTMLEALPSCCARAHSRGGQYPLYFEAENGRGVLCVVMVKKDGANV